tara:strand:- start:2308 stop:2895 length:588 start_codon:yes stop_codon:yes gene_type:complete
MSDPIVNAAEPVNEDDDSGIAPAEPNPFVEHLNKLDLQNIMDDEDGTFNTVLQEIYNMLAVGSSADETINDFVIGDRNNGILDKYGNTAKLLRTARTAIGSIITKWIGTWDRPPFPPTNLNATRETNWWKSFECTYDLREKGRMAMVSNGCACSACYHSAAACCVCQRAYPRGRRAAFSVFNSYAYSGIRTFGCR